jgi:hypothetical protein
MSLAKPYYRIKVIHKPGRLKTETTIISLPLHCDVVIAGEDTQVGTVRTFKPTSIYCVLPCKYSVTLNHCEQGYTVKRQLAPHTMLSKPMVEAIDIGFSSSVTIKGKSVFRILSGN